MRKAQRYWESGIKTDTPYADAGILHLGCYFGAPVRIEMGIGHIAVQNVAVLKGFYLNP